MWLHPSLVPFVSHLSLRTAQRGISVLVVDHITLLIFALISACCLDKWDVLRMSQPKGKPTGFSPGKRAFGTYALVQLLKRLNKIKTEGIEDLAVFSIKSLEGFAIRDGSSHEDGVLIHERPTNSDQCEGTTNETTNVGFTFPGGETEAASA